MLPVSVVLGSHCHVPDGLAETEYETAYNERLKPFLSALYRYPGIPAVLHYSGPLFYWVERKRPEFFDLLRKMLRRKQIEILSGGFYEPAMHLLMPQDRTGQIEMLSTYIRRHFGKRVTGAWIPGACWDQNAVTSLSSCAISYTFLPERYFAAAGVQTADLGLPVYTENQGALVMVFPILPAGLENDGLPLTVENLLALAGERGRRGVYTIFPERFQASSPGGSGKDYAAGIGAFLESCAASEHGINWTLPSRFYEEYTGEGKQSLQRRYFPCAGEKKFLTECSEANTIYAKMIFTRDLVRQLRGDRERKNAALYEVYKAQSCNLYTYTASARHNVSDPALRKAAYRALLSAEKTVREITKTVNSLYNFDFDFDGGAEEIFRGTSLCFYTHRKGGHVFGIDYLPACWNYIDSFRHYSFIETLYPANVFDSADGTGIREKLEETDRKLVRRCGEEWWEETAVDRARQKLTFTLPKAPSGTAFGHIRIKKTYRLRQDTIIVSYTIYNRGTAEELFLFCPEFHFAFAGYGEGQLRIFVQKNGERVPVAAGDYYANALQHIQFQDLDNETVIAFSSDRQFDALLGIDNVFGRYQSSSLVLTMPVYLESGTKISREFCLSIMR